jgi:ATP-dependent Clp protease protease subunit
MSLLGLGKKLLMGLGILIVGSLVGFGIYQGKNYIQTQPVYSSFEDKKPYEPIKVVNESQPIKPTIGPAVEPVNPATLDVLTLRPDNTLIFNEVVTEESVSKFQVKLNEMSNKLPANQEIIVVLYTPGGSVSAGMLMIDSLKAVPQKVKTLTIFAASMGFQIVQNLGERMIIPSGILMSHRATLGLEGELDGEFDVRLNAIRRQIRYMDQIAANRMKMELEAYRTLIRDEYWVHGFESVDDRAADKLILARCGKEMTGTEDKEFQTFFGPVKVTFSKCPLITAPLEIKFDGMKEEGISEMKTFMTLLYQDPKEFFKTYIKTEKYLKVLVNKKN